MQQFSKTKTDGSNHSAAGNEENGAASTISDRDLKILSHEYVGECDGIFYFRDPLHPGELSRGDESDKEELCEMQRKHPLIDAATASAALRMRKMMSAKTPFGTVAGDMVGS